MLETEAHHDPLNSSEERLDYKEKRRFIQTFQTVVSRFPIRWLELYSNNLQ